MLPLAERGEKTHTETQETRAVAGSVLFLSLIKNGKSGLGAAKGERL
jgi:hypothetical protein